MLRLADHLARLDRSARELYGFGVPADVGGPGAGGGRRLGSAGSRCGSCSRPAGAVDVTRGAGPAAPVRDRGSVGARRAGRVAAQVGRPHRGSTAGEPADRGRCSSRPTAPCSRPTRGNVFVLDADGALMTPPLRDDLLPGVTRRAVLDLARDRGWPARIAPFGVDALRRAAAVVLDQQPLGRRADHRGGRARAAARPAPAAAAAGRDRGRICGIGVAAPTRSLARLTSVTERRSRRATPSWRLEMRPALMRLNRRIRLENKDRPHTLTQLSALCDGRAARAAERRRPGRVRAGAAAVDDQGDRRARRGRPGPPRRAPDRQAAGDHRDHRRPARRCSTSSRADRRRLARRPAGQADRRRARAAARARRRSSTSSSKT